MIERDISNQSVVRIAMRNVSRFTRGCGRSTRKTVSLLRRHYSKLANASTVPIANVVSGEHAQRRGKPMRVVAKSGIDHAGVSVFIVYFTPKLLD